jgi:hypothetical protein
LKKGSLLWERVLNSLVDKTDIGEKADYLQERDATSHADPTYVWKKADRDHQKRGGGLKPLADPKENQRVLKSLADLTDIGETGYPKEGDSAG